jgi:hypothetical protein
MGRRKLDYYVKANGYRPDGTIRLMVQIDGQRYTLKATTEEAAEAEAKARYEEIKAAEAAAIDAGKTPVKPKPGTLRDGFGLYMASEKWDTYKPLTHRQMRSATKFILETNAEHHPKQLGEVPLRNWLHDADAPDAVRRVMALCGKRWSAANHRLKAMNNFFEWLLDTDEAQAGEARLKLKIGKDARNPCLGVKKAQPKRDENGEPQGKGYTPFTNDQVDDWLLTSKDDPEEHRAVRFLLMVGGRTSDLHRLGRHMIRDTPEGRVLTFTCEKGKDSLYRKSRQNSVARVPLVPELEALIAEVPKERLCFIHSALGRPYSCAESLGNRIRDWRRDAGLPEGLSAHGMRKASTHWWLRNHRDLIANNFSLKTIFGWMTDKELERYTEDFDREQESRAQLVRLADRRKKTA